MTKTPPKAIKINYKFGKWLIIKQVESVRSGNSVSTQYLCRCGCGIEKVVRAGELRSGRSSQCRACRDKERFIDTDKMVGTKIGKWKILKTIKNEKRPSQRYLLCQCECGLKQTVSASRLKLGKAKSCHLCNVTKHGLEGSRIHNSWRCMKARCYNKKHTHYRHYGGREIKVCDSWKNSFLNFLKDMGERPDGYQLDRTNNNGNYEPENCRWATPKENSNNRRSPSKSSPASKKYIQLTIE